MNEKKRIVWLCVGLLGCGMPAGSATGTATIVPLVNSPYLKVPSPWGAGFLFYSFPESGICPSLPGPFNFSVEFLTPTMAVPRAKVPPIIDGKLDDACWQSAAMLSGFSRLKQGITLTENGFVVAEENQTWLWLAYDDRALYIAFRTRADSVNPCPPRPRDSYYLNEEIELFLAPPGIPGPGYCQFILLPGCLSLDSRGGDTTWNRDAEYKDIVKEGVWEGEFTITFAALGTPPPKNGTEWRANFIRAICWKTLTGWASRAKNFSPEELGHLKFTDRAPIVQVKKLAPRAEDCAITILGQDEQDPAKVVVKSFGDGATSLSVIKEKSGEILWRQPVVFSLGRPWAYDWKSSDDRRTASYALNLTEGVTLTGWTERLSVDTVACSFSVRNNSSREYQETKLTLCLNLGAMPGFEGVKDTENYYILRDGKQFSFGKVKDFIFNIATNSGNASLKKNADIPFVSLKDKTKERYVGLCWKAGTCGRGDPSRPSMHLEVFIPACAPGAKSEAKGRIFFHEGDFAGLIEKARKFLAGGSD